MVLPLLHPVKVKAGDVLRISFQYRAGASIASLQGSLNAGVVYEAAMQAGGAAVAYA